MKPGFQNKLKITHLGGKDFRVDADLKFYSAKYEQVYIAPKGTITDFASIPQLAQSFVGVLGNNIRSAVLHDFHCREEGKKANKVTQKIADDLFREGLALDHVRFSKARVMLGGVRLFQRVKYAFKRGESYG